MTTTERLLQLAEAWVDAAKEAARSEEIDTAAIYAMHVGFRCEAETAFRSALSSTLEAPADWVLMRQAIGNLRVFITGMDENNWRDMRLNAERQLDSLSRLIKGGSDATPVK